MNRLSAIFASTPPSLKPQDVAIALKALLLESGRETGNGGSENSLRNSPWTLAQLSKETYVSIGEIHNSLNRLADSRLFRAEDRTIRRAALEEFLVHGIRYAFPPTRGSFVRGIPTAYAAPMLRSLFLGSDLEIPVWPFDEGDSRGLAFSPLYASAPLAALEDSLFYELLAITDALRGDSRTRERNAAIELLRARIRTDE